MAFKKVVLQNNLSPIHSKIYKWFFVPENMEPTKNIILDIEETLTLQKQCDDLTALLTLRKKIQKISMFQKQESPYKEMLKYKQQEINELYAIIGLKNQDKKKLEPIDYGLIYHFS